MTEQWAFYQDNRGKWRWRRTAPNGEIIGASTQGYAQIRDCERNADLHGWGGGLPQDPWQSMQTAPRSGFPILAWFDDDRGTMACIRWKVVSGVAQDRWVDDLTGADLPRPPIAWRLRPEPPK